MNGDEIVVLSASFTEEHLEKSKWPATEEGYIELWTTAVEKEDDNVFYCPGIPDAGNQHAPYFYGAHIEGCKTRAI